MFSVTARTQYGIRALLHLAVAEGHAGTAASIASSQAISPKFLEGILSSLVASGLLISGRGKGGGYRLARPPASITMLEVLSALDGDTRLVGCIEDSQTCGFGADCLPRRFWMGLQETIDGYLASRTLADIVDSREPEHGDAGRAGEE